MKCEISRFLSRFSGSPLCIRCKGGKLLCGRDRCPLYSVFRIRVDRKFFGPSPPSVFFGFRGYPLVTGGPCGAYGDPETVENPARWFGLDFQDILKLRASVFVAGKRIRADLPDVRVSELSLSVRPVDVEMEFRRPVEGTLRFSGTVQPVGPVARLERFELAGNPKVPEKVERVVNDDLKAGDSLRFLYAKGFDVYYLVRLLTSGSLGFKRKVVPTRWAITAVDDVISRDLARKVLDFPELSGIEVYEGEYLENRYTVVFLPGPWSFEMFEVWSPKAVWTPETVVNHEFEGPLGRKDYAESEAGAYYAARLGAAEFLYRRKKQASVLVIREIFDTYVIPVGVWQVRENVRRALMTKPRKFGSVSELKKYLKERVRGLELSKSRLLTQKRLW